MPFDIIICGAGLAGLGAAIALRRKGHNVTVLEAAQQLSEVGAGIQIPPNSCRVLQHYGVLDDILGHVVWPEALQFRRYSTGEVIGKTPLQPSMVEKYGFPYLLIHRADYQQCLFDHAARQGVTVLLNSPVERVDEYGPSVVLRDGPVLKADLIVGADGIRSKTRRCFLGADDVAPTSSPNCAFRATVPRDVMLADPDIAHLMTDVGANCWIGHERHVMAYPIRRGELYNLVMSHPGQASVGKWNEPGNLLEMKQHYSNFDPTICKVLEKVQGCLKWKLADLPPLPTWVSNQGRVVLIGDAAHAMVPYLAQGAAIAIEDGAALAECLDQATNASHIPKALAAFEKIRKPRCETIQSLSKTNGDIWHLPDGLQQDQRDKFMMGKAAEGIDTNNGSKTQNPNRWSDKDLQPWLFGYDAIKETRNALNGTTMASL